MKLAGFGMQIELDDGWEARLFRRPARRVNESTNPIMHLANFPLPDDRSDFGGGVVEHMRPGDCFVVLFDYGSEVVDQPLFARRGVPRLFARDFAAANLQRTISGQAGAQHFFQLGGRALGLYVVLGSRADVRDLGALNSMLARTQVGAW